MAIFRKWPQKDTRHLARKWFKVNVFFFFEAQIRFSILGRLQYFRIFRKYKNKYTVQKASSDRQHFMLDTVLGRHEEFVGGIRFYHEPEI